MYEHYLTIHMSDESTNVHDTIESIRKSGDNPDGPKGTVDSNGGYVEFGQIKPKN